jgi:hypothetical protein
MISMNGRRAVLLIVALGMVLSGCIKSKQAKFPPASAVAALGGGGHYRMYDRIDGGKFVKGDPIEIRTRKEGGYDFISEPSDPVQVTIHPIAGGLHVVQSRKPKSEDGYEYLIVRITDGEIMSYAPDCEKQDKAKLSALGASIKKDECSIDGVTDPAAFFSALDPGEPAAKLMRE